LGNGLKIKSIPYDYINWAERDEQLAECFNSVDELVKVTLEPIIDKLKKGEFLSADEADIIDKLQESQLGGRGIIS
ncbi:MAG: hypothetical protein ACRC2V_12545, partial [Xenococcaceae cyanobacterium]